MSFVPKLGVEPTGVLLVVTGLLSLVEGNLLGVKRDMTMLNADCITLVVCGGLIADPLLQLC